MNNLLVTVTVHIQVSVSKSVCETLNMFPSDLERSLSEFQREKLKVNTRLPHIYPEEVSVMLFWFFFYFLVFLLQTKQGWSGDGWTF